MTTQARRHGALGSIAITADHPHYLRVAKVQIAKTCISTSTPLAFPFPRTLTADDLDVRLQHRQSAIARAIGGA